MDCRREIPLSAVKPMGTLALQSTADNGGTLLLIIDPSAPVQMEAGRGCAEMERARPEI